MVYEYKIYCDDCYKFAYLDGFIGHLGEGKIYHQHETFIDFMIEHGRCKIVILGQSADDLSRSDYSEFKKKQTSGETADKVKT